MLAGRLRPELGGHPRYLDAIGVNYYPWNQWIFEGPIDPGASIEPDHPGYRPFRSMLAEVADRYRRPSSSPRPGPRGTTAPAGSRASPTRSSPRSVPGCRSKGFASTRSSTFPAGPTTATARTASGTTPTTMVIARSMRPSQRQSGSCRNNSANGPRIAAFEESIRTTRGTTEARVRSRPGKTTRFALPPGWPQVVNERPHGLLFAEFGPRTPSSARFSAASACFWRFAPAA